VNEKKKKKKFINSKQCLTSQNFAMRIVFFFHASLGFNFFSSYAGLPVLSGHEVEAMFEELNNHNQNSETSPIVEGEFILFYILLTCFLVFFFRKVDGAVNQK
jgi:hypothetical protein